MTNKRNDKRYTYVGDIHGCLDEFQELLFQKVQWNPYDPNDVVILLGDLVDRGPDSVDMVAFAKNLNVQIGRNNFFCIRGNHEEKYRKIHRAMQKNKGFIINDPSKKEIYEALVDRDLIDWVSCLPTHHLVPEHNILAVHAGVLPNKGDPRYQDPSVHMYTRYLDRDTYKPRGLRPPDFKRPENSIDWSETYHGPYNIIYGHQVNSLNDITNRKIQEPYQVETIGIDTGCCFGGHLTAYSIDANKTVIINQVKAKKEYTKFKFAIS